MNGENKDNAAQSRSVAKIVASFVSNNAIGSDQLPELIRSVHHAIGQLGKPAAAEGALVPAVSVRRSVQRDHVVCLDCGWKGKMLRRHLSTRHGLNSDEYLRRWRLPSDHPLTAPNYSDQRSALAKELGLGRASRTEAPPPPAAPEPPAPTQARRRGRGAARAAPPA